MTWMQANTIIISVAIVTFGYVAHLTYKRDMAICQLNGHSEATCFHTLNR